MEGDVLRAEELYSTKIDSQEAVSNLLMSQIDVLTELRGALGETHLRRINQVHNRANVGWAEYLRMQQKRKERISAELDTLGARQEEFQAETRTREEAFTQNMLKSDTQMKTKLEQQQALWNQIEAAEAELVRLTEEHTETVRTRLALIAERREQEVIEAQRMKFIKERGEALERTLQQMETAEQLIDTLDEFVSGACRAMEKRVHVVEQEIEDLKLGVHQQHLKEFRGQYLTLGELIYRKEQNAQEIDKKIEMAKVQQELLMDSLNPAAKEAADRRKQLVKVKEEMQERLDGLNTRAAGFLEHFRITEQALITAGQAFTHPHDELQQTNENRKLKILEYHKLGAAEIAEGEELVAAMEQSIRNPAIKLLTTGTPSTRKAEPFRVKALSELEDDLPAPDT
jgi:hypothetical protein